MKIGLLAARMDVFGGVENVMLRTALHLRSRGHEPVMVSTAFHAELARALQAGTVEMRVVGNPHDTGRIGRLAAMRAATTEALADCEAVNVHNFPANLWIEEQEGRPLVYACHEPPRHLHEDAMNPVFLGSRFNTRPWYTRAWDSLMNTRWRALDLSATRRLRRILTNSRYTAGKIEQIYGFSAVPCYFAPLPPDPSSPAPCTASEFRMLFVGRLTPMKNLETAVEAVALLPAEVRPLLHVVGEGDQRSRLEALSRERGISERVKFLGGIPDAQLLREYAEAKAVLYIPFDEPMGLVPMEAGLLGVPSVVSSHGGPAEIVVNEKTGLYADALDPQAVANALLRFALDESLRQRCGKAAAARMRAEMHWGLYTHALETLLGIPTPTAEEPT